MKRILHEHVGRLLLVLAVVWVGLATVLFPAQPASLPGAGRLADYREQVCVAYIPGELACGEQIFPAHRAEAYRREEIAAWVPEPEVPPPPVLDLPTGAPIVPPPQLLTDPGPTLEGADRLPRWDG